MAHELDWSGAFYESLAGSINRMTRGGPIGMTAGVIGEASAAMRGMNIPWQGPRTTASLAAAVGGGFVLLNAGRSVVDAVNAVGQGDYGSALANAAIGVGWYAAGRFALGTLGRQLPVEAGALAAYEEAARAKLANEDPARYQQTISRFKKQQDMAQAAADSAKIASTTRTNPTTAQIVAEDAAVMAADVATTVTETGQLAFDFGPGYAVKQSAQPTQAAGPIRVRPPRQLKLDFPSPAEPQQLELPLDLRPPKRQLRLNLFGPPPETGPGAPSAVTSPIVTPAPKAPLALPPPRPNVRPGPPPVVTSQPTPVEPTPVVTPRSSNRPRGGVRGMVRGFSVLSRRAARRAARRLEALERWVTSFAAASTFRGLRF